MLRHKPESKEKMSVLIDIPQVAYRTWEIEYRIYDAEGKRDYWAEIDAENDLKTKLERWAYSEDNDHVR